MSAVFETPVAAPLRALVVDDAPEITQMLEPVLKGEGFETRTASSGEEAIAIARIFIPDIVVLAGGVTAAGDALFVPLRAEVRRRAFTPAVQAVRIVPGELPGTAGVVGAVASFKQQHLGGV